MCETTDKNDIVADTSTDLEKALADALSTIQTTQELTDYRDALEKAQKALAKGVSVTLYTWTTKWRDAYDMTARILATDAATCAEFTTSKDTPLIVRPTFSPRTYEEWISSMRYSDLLSVECGDFTYNPLSSDYGINDDLTDWQIGDGFIICDIMQPFRGEEDWYSYQIPCEFFDILQADGHAAARTFANEYVLKNFILPYLEKRFTRTFTPVGKSGRKALKSDLAVLKQELQNARIAKDELSNSSSANSLILVDAIIALYEEQIAAVKAKRKELKEQKKGKKGKKNKKKDKDKGQN